MAAKPPVKIRRPPPAVDLARAEAFVSKRRSDAQTSERGIVTRQDGRRLRRMTVYVPDELARALDVYCAEHHCERSELVVDAVRAKLDR